MLCSRNAFASPQRHKAILGVLQLFLSKYGCHDAANVGDEATRHDIGGNSGLQLAVADEHNHGMKEVMVEFEKISETLSMSIILS